MTKIIILITLLSFILSGCKSTKWTEFISQEDQFAVQLPGEPTRTSSQIKTPFGTSALRKFSWDSPDAIFEIACSDYSDSLFVVYSADEILNSVCATYTAGGRVEPLSYEELSLDGFPGRELTLHSPDGTLFLKVRSYLVNHRLYQTSAITPRAKSMSVNVDKFLDSFRLIPPLQSVENSARDTTETP